MTASPPLPLQTLVFIYFVNPHPPIKNPSTWYILIHIIWHSCYCARWHPVKLWESGRVCSRVSPASSIGQPMTKHLEANEFRLRELELRLFEYVKCRKGGRKIWCADLYQAIILIRIQLTSLNWMNNSSWIRFLLILLQLTAFETFTMQLRLNKRTEASC